MGDRLLVIAGPTASGKTAAALALAHAVTRTLGRTGDSEAVELVGADSVQVYRRLEVGSARPAPEELGGIVHHLLGVVDLDAPFDAARYVPMADEAIAGARSRGRIPIVVGGTGLYLRALVRGLAAGIPADPVLRGRLQARAALGRDELRGMHAELAAVDPVYAGSIQPTDPIRVVRALEVWETSGVPLSEHHRRHAALPPRYDARIVALEVPRDALRARIAARTRAMLAGRWVDEVRGILADGFDPDLKPLRSVGYAQVVAHLRGEIPPEALEPAVVTATCAFAKRQRTWFRGERGVEWTAPEALTTPDHLAALGRWLTE